MNDMLNERPNISHVGDKGRDPLDNKQENIIAVPGFEAKGRGRRGRGSGSFYSPERGAFKGEVVFSPEIKKVSTEIRDLFNEDAEHFFELRNTTVDGLIGVEIDIKKPGTDLIGIDYGVIVQMEADLGRDLETLSFERYRDYLRRKGITPDFRRVSDLVRTEARSTRLVDGGYWNERDILTRGFNLFKDSVVTARMLGISPSVLVPNQFFLEVSGEIEKRGKVAEELLKKCGYKDEDIGKMSISIKINRAIKISKVVESGIGSDDGLFSYMRGYDRQSPSNKKSWIDLNAQQVFSEKQKAIDSSEVMAGLWEGFINELRYDLYGVSSKDQFLSKHSSRMDSGNFRGIEKEEIFDPFTRTNRTMLDMLNERFDSRKVGRLGGVDAAAIRRFAGEYPRWVSSSDSLTAFFANPSRTNPEVWSQFLAKYKTGKSPTGETVAAGEVLNLSSITSLLESDLPNYPELSAYGDAYRLTTKIWNLVVKEGGFIKDTDVSTWDELVGLVELKLGIELERDSFDNLTPESMTKKTTIDGFISRSLAWMALFGYGSKDATYSDGKPCNALASGAVCVMNMGSFLINNSARIKAVAAWRKGYNSLEPKLRRGDTFGDPFDDPTKCQEVAVNLGKWLETKTTGPFAQFSSFRKMLFEDSLSPDIMGKSDLQAAIGSFASYLVDAKAKVFDYICSVPDPNKIGEFVSEMYRCLCVSYKSNWPTWNDGEMREVALSVTRRVAWLCAATSIFCYDSNKRTLTSGIGEKKTDDLLTDVHLFTSVDLATDDASPDHRTRLFSGVDIAELKKWTTTLTLADVAKVGLVDILKSAWESYMRDSGQSFGKK